MASTLVVQIQTNLSQTEIKNRINHLHNGPREALVNYKALIKAIQGGVHRAKMSIATSAAAPVAASGTVTLVSVADSDTITIGGVVLTAKTSPSGSAQFARGVSDTADAAALKACINAHATLSQVLVASSALGVVTISALTKGVIGNFIVMSRTGTTMTLVQLASGAGGATEAFTTLSLGL